MPRLLQVSIKVFARSSLGREGTGNEAGEGYDGSAGKGPGGVVRIHLGRTCAGFFASRCTGATISTNWIRSAGVLLFPRPEDPKQCVF